MSKVETIKSALKFLVQKQTEQGSHGFSDADDNDVTWKEVLEWIEQPTVEMDEDCISREDAINVVHNYFVKYLELNDDICLDGIRSLSPVIPKASCKACREQVLKYLEKEDWADTVNCVMTMPFMKKELNKRFGVKKGEHKDE